MIQWFRDFMLAMGQSLRLQRKGRMTPVVLLLATIILFVMLFSLEEVKEEKSRIAIGIADEDQSELSEALAERIRQLDLYEVTFGSKKELTELVKDGELSAAGVIEAGYESSIKQGKEKNLITIYESEAGGALLLGDILAGVMMQDICQAKGYLTLLAYEEKTGKVLSEYEDYLAYVRLLKEEEALSFSFDIRYASPKGQTAKKPPQSVLYQQGIFAIFAMMTGVLALYTVLPFRELNYGTASERVKTLPAARSAFYAGNAAAAFVLPVLFAFLFLFLVVRKESLSFEQFIALLICTGAYVCGIVCIMLVASLLISGKTVYQMGMLVMLLIFGIFGLISVVEGLFLPEGFGDGIPNAWYVRRAMEIINVR